MSGKISQMEASMAACAPRSMTNHHDSSALGAVVGMVRVWWRRYAERTELAAWTDRDLNDVGLSRDDIADEIDKPFWRG
jgi:uncharacterized protein YjiS (DUF1127 family)